MGGNAHHRLLEKYVINTYIGIPVTELYRLRPSQLDVLSDILDSVSVEPPIKTEQRNDVGSIVAECKNEGLSNEQVYADPRLKDIQRGSIRACIAHWTMGRYNKENK